ncbi:hypothetical protein ABTZ58_10205 [Streptomyces sp. NPDC094143]|uniref:hypothetical protein n=1 Tax=Streptomyces sp. NPDC094143 TaxID=3155310 RepID=UPI00332EA22F
MTAPAHLSPTAGMFNALLRLYIRRARPIIAAQQTAVDEARNLNHRLTTARDFADTAAAGYIDRTGLE